MKILVTGATGMVGRNLLADPRAAEFDLLTPGRRALDLTDSRACRAYVDQQRPDAIIHLGAVVGGIQANIDEPVRFLVENTRISLNVLEAARAGGVSTVLNVGSSCMYPRDVADALTPDMLLSGELEPTNEGYALAKLIAWKLGAYMRKEDPSLAYKTIVPCNLYGLYDRFDPTKSHMIPAAVMKVVDAVSAGVDEVTIWGDGTARREFMFAADLADFIWTWIGRADALPDMLNVGVGADHSISEYYRAIADVAGFEGRFVHDLSKPVGMRRKLLDVTGQEQLGWRPGTRLVEGIRQTVDYYRRIRASA